MNKIMTSADPFQNHPQYIPTAELLKLWEHERQKERDTYSEYVIGEYHSELGEVLLSSFCVCSVHQR